MTQVANIILEPNISGTDQRSQLNDILADFVTGHAGASQPAYLDASTEGMWVKEVSGTVREIYHWDKTNNILLWTIDIAANTATPSGASIQLGKVNSSKTGAFTAVNADNGTLFRCNATSASFTASLDVTATLDTGWYTIIQKTDSTANTVTIDPDSTNTINGATTLVLSRNNDAALIIKLGATTFAGILLPDPANLAPIASPTFTGTPAAPTPAPGDNSTKIATTAFVATSYAPLASPALTGTPTCPTQSAGNNSTRIASTAFVQQEIASSVPTGLFKVIRRVVFTASGTYTPNANMTYCEVELVGGGSGGKGSTAGGNGGQSLFGALLTANGATGGGASTGGIGGTATSGDINVQGQNGGTTVLGFGSASSGGSSLFQMLTHARGGNSVLGMGGVVTGASAVQAGVGYGAGGSVRVAAVDGDVAGGGGGYCRKLFDAATIGASKSVTIGAAGTAGGSAAAGSVGLCLIREYCTA